jgi:hypothetical protein
MESVERAREVVSAAEEVVGTHTIHPRFGYDDLDSSALHGPGGLRPYWWCNPNMLRSWSWMRSCRGGPPRSSPSVTRWGGSVKPGPRQT